MSLTGIYLWQESNTLEALGLEDRHDSLNDFMMMVAGLLIFQNVQQGIDSYHLIIIVGRCRGANVIPRSRVH